MIARGGSIYLSHKDQTILVRGYCGVCGCALNIGRMGFHTQVTAYIQVTSLSASHRLVKDSRVRNFFSRELRVGITEGLVPVRASLFSGANFLRMRGNIQLAFIIATLEFGLYAMRRR